MMFRIFPSINFECYLTLIKYSNFIIGNSSSGIYEGPYYGIPTINIATRQHNRFNHKSIINVDFDRQQILENINSVCGNKYVPINYFGKGNSAITFIDILRNSHIWKLSTQKYINV